jgi:predicted transcriptional regulator
VASVCKYVVTLVRSSTILPVVREIIHIKKLKKIIIVESNPERFIDHLQYILTSGVHIM